jgi:hypothetical protein
MDCNKHNNKAPKEPKRPEESDNEIEVIQLSAERKLQETETAIQAIARDNQQPT